MAPTQELFAAAAAPTLERIRQDRRKAPAQVQPLLTYLEAHLFDAGLDANRLKLACGVRDNTLPLQFHHVLGLPPYAYIEDCRLEIACRLLRDTELKIWQIAQRLGYSALQVFSRAFQRWSGDRPSVYRQEIRREPKRGKKVDRRTSSGTIRRPVLVNGRTPVDRSTLHKALKGQLDREEADELARVLAQLYPESFSSPRGVKRRRAAFS